MALDVAAIIPLIGVFKYADDLSYGVKTLFKNGDEVVDGSRRIIKAADSLGDLSKTGRTVWNHMADSLREMAKNVKKADMLDNARYVDNAVDAVSDTGKRLDDVVGGGKSEKILSNGQSLDDMAKLYAEKVNSNNKWSWMDDFPDAGNLSKADKADIKNLAIEKELIPNVPVKTVTDSNGNIYRYVDFNATGLVKEKVTLPEHLWSESDSVQFRWLDNKIGGRPAGYTWHHSETTGQMELVPTGIHNIYNHNGGRTVNHWAYREGGR